jgi:hypothetical protein
LIIFPGFHYVYWHIPAECQKAYRVQLAVFRRCCCSRTQQVETIKQRLQRSPSQQREELCSSSSAEDDYDAEPLLKKGQTTYPAASGGDDGWNVGDVKKFVLKETWARKEVKKLKFSPKHKHIHKKYPKAETTLKNKKSVMETLAMLFSPTATVPLSRENKYFCYHRLSEYSIGPRGELNQTEDLKRYYKQKQKTSQG